MDEVRDDARRYGRRTFLGVSALGLSSLVWGEPVWRRVSGLSRPIWNALPPSLVPSGWRIYTVAAHDAALRPGHLAAARSAASSTGRRR